MKATIHPMLVATAALLAASSANALSISATPATQDVLSGNQATVTLSMSFEAQTIGGGIILDFSGPISFVSFTPSAYFNSLNTDPATDADFTGFGTGNKPATAEFEIHFGSFTGTGGDNVLGTLTFNTAGTGQGLVDLSASPGNFYGGFLDLNASPQTVTFNDAQINVVPLPATAWLFLAGLGAAATRVRRRRS